MKNLIKGMDKEGEGFQYLEQKFLYLSEAKPIKGIFVGPQEKNF